MALERLELNLLRVFHLIYVHRSVAAASRMLGVTPSAVSHALARLRVLLDDELFVTTSDGMAPTQRAAELAPRLGQGFEMLVRALEVMPFEPARTVRTFCLASSDYTTTVLCPALLDRVLRLAPNVGLRVLPFGRSDIAEQLDTGRIDLVVGWFDRLPPHLRRRTLLEEQEALVVRSGHPLARRKPTRADLFEYPHVVVDLLGNDDPAASGFLDERGIMRRVWIERLLLESRSEQQPIIGRVAATLPNYLAVSPVIQSTDAIATLPRRLAVQAAARDHVVLLDLPYEPLTIAVEAVWHERADADAGARWLTEQVEQAAASVKRSEGIM